MVENRSGGVVCWDVQARIGWMSGVGGFEDMTEDGRGGRGLSKEEWCMSHTARRCSHCHEEIMKADEDS